MKTGNNKKTGYSFNIVITCAFFLIAAFAVIPLVNSTDYSVHAATTWEKKSSGTQYYVSFPSGYNHSSALYTKYNRAPLQAYENSTNKRVVNTTRCSWIYWHWTFSCGVLPNDDYNVFINDFSCWEGSRHFQYFTDFESAQNYPTWSQDSNVFKCWRGNPADGSWWWFRLPVYRQDYTDYTAKTYSTSTSISSNEVKIDSKTCPKTLKIVTGNSVASAVRVTCNGKSLLRGTDYTITYTINKNGKVKVVIKGIGKYTGTITKYFKIVPQKTSLKTLKCSKNKITANWKVISGVAGYQIQCCSSSKFKNGCKTVTVKDCSNKSKTICNLKSGKKYYIRIRVYLIIDGTTFCSKWSGVKTVKTKKSAPKFKFRYDCLVKGNMAYCCVGNAVYKVNLKTKKKTMLIKHKSKYDTSGLSINGRYLFYMLGFIHSENPAICRFDLKTGNIKKIGTGIYVLRGNKIYFTKYIMKKNGYYSYFAYSMDFAGKNLSRQKKYDSHNEYDGEPAWGEHWDYSNSSKYEIRYGNEVRIKGIVRSSGYLVIRNKDKIFLGYVYE